MYLWLCCSMRWCDNRYTSYNVRPAFPFGHGLSYTRFSYSALNTTVAGFSSPEAVVVISATVTNAGAVLGAEVAQLYVTFPVSANTPPLQLKGFSKTAQLAPGGSTVLTFPLRERDLSVWDVAVHGWRAVTGEFKFFVGASSADSRLSGRFEVSV